MSDPFVLFQEENVRAGIILFSGLFLYSAGLGYFIRLVISLLYKICGSHHGKG